MELFYFSLLWLWLMKILSLEYFQWKACPENNHNILLIWFFYQLMQLQFTVTGFSLKGICPWSSSSFELQNFLCKPRSLTIFFEGIPSQFHLFITTNYLEEVNTKSKWNDGTIPPTLLPPTRGSSTVWMILENGNIPGWWTVIYQCL